jgi:hypothetical protein
LNCSIPPPDGAFIFDAGSPGEAALSVRGNGAASLIPL